MSTILVTLLVGPITFGPTQTKFWVCLGTPSPETAVKHPPPHCEVLSSQSLPSNVGTFQTVHVHDGMMKTRPYFVSNKSAKYVTITHVNGVMRSSVMILLQICCRVSLWKNFEHWLTVDKVTGKNVASSFPLAKILFSLRTAESSTECTVCG